MSHPTKQHSLAGTWYSREESDTCVNCTRVMVSRLNLAPGSEYDVKASVREKNGKLYLVLRDPNSTETDLDL